MLYLTPSPESSIRSKLEKLSWIYQSVKLNMQMLVTLGHFESNFFFFFFFKGIVSLCSPDWPRTHCVDQADWLQR